MNESRCRGFWRERASERKPVGWDETKESGALGANRLAPRGVCSIAPVENKKQQTRVDQNKVEWIDVLLLFSFVCTMGRPKKAGTPLPS
jgi:hypothetical protein